MSAVVLPEGKQSFTTNAGLPGVGFKLYTYVPGTSTPKSTYTDQTGGPTNTNPVIANARGEMTVYWNGAYDVTLKDSLDNLIWGPLRLETPEAAGSAAALRADLANAVSNTAGAAIVGYTEGLGYPALSVGKRLEDILNPPANYTETRAIGVAAAGANNARANITTASGNASGTSDIRGRQETITYSGANAAAQVNARNTQVELRHTAGAVTFAMADQAFVRLGLAGSATGNVTTARVYEAHIANESNNTIGECSSFTAADVDLIDGTGTVANVFGFNAGNLGHATRITGIAAGVRVSNMTQGAPTTAAFYTDMSGGTGMYSIRSVGAAKFSHFGAGRFGDSTVPGDSLEVNGYCKLSTDGTIVSGGSFHELISHRDDYIAQCRNKTAGTPNGLDVFFSAAAPNNTTQIFARYRDNAANRCLIYSNGNLQNANNSYGAISDAKLKTGIRDAGSQWDDIKALRLRKYKLIADGEGAREHLGLVAQEAELVSPGLVYDSPDEDGTTTKGVQYSVLYLKAVKALQEAMERIEALEAKVAKLV